MLQPGGTQEGIFWGKRKLDQIISDSVRKLRFVAASTLENFQKIANDGIELDELTDNLNFDSLPRTYFKTPLHDTLSHYSTFENSQADILDNYAGRIYPEQEFTPRKSSASDTTSVASSSALSFPNAKFSNRKFFAHRISKTDTLPGIAVKYNMNISELRAINRLAVNDDIYSRNAIYIPIENVTCCGDCVFAEELNSPVENSVDYSMEKEKNLKVKRFQISVQCSNIEAWNWMESSRFNLAAALESYWAVECPDGLSSLLPDVSLSPSLSSDSTPRSSFSNSFDSELDSIPYRNIRHLDN
ncbi:hypothetical protein HK098_001585 [Nowakowskiella sp. JEL0407]|nr:hypothetical protein HK098_001585 [Nowakowskiella sp. JEL0407]